MENFQPQQVLTTYPSPAIVVNTPTPMAYTTYSPHTSIQPSYYPSLQPQIIHQPAVYHPSYHHQQGGGYLHNSTSCITQLCMLVLCLSACTFCCNDGCCAVDECCYGGGGAYNTDDCCGCC